MNENRTTQRSGPGRTPTARPTIGMIAHWIEGSHQAQWLGAVDAARAQQADLITFVGRELGHPDNFYAQANVIYDLASPAYLDGLVIWTSSLPVFVGQQQAAAFCQRYRPLPMVSIGPPIAGCPSVLMPNRQGMRAAVSHLIAVHGYRRIAFIRGPANHPYAQERYQGYLDALAQHGLPHDPTLVSPPAHFWGVEEAAAPAQHRRGGDRGRER
jgi:DNA-binding LacI/PurR family transcriptional regulator